MCLTLSLGSNRQPVPGQRSTSKKQLTSIRSNLSPRYGHVIPVSGYLVLTGVTCPWHWCPISKMYACKLATVSNEVLPPWWALNLSPWYGYVYWSHWLTWRGGRTYVRTDVHDVMAIKPNFLTSMGYHIFLTMVLCARTPLARAELRYERINQGNLMIFLTIYRIQNDLMFQSLEPLKNIAQDFRTGPYFIMHTILCFNPLGLWRFCSFFLVYIDFEKTSGTSDWNTENRTFFPGIWALFLQFYSFFNFRISARSGVSSNRCNRVQILKHNKQTK